MASAGLGLALGLGLGLAGSGLSIMCRVNHLDWLRFSHVPWVMREVTVRVRIRVRIRALGLGSGLPVGDPSLLTGC